MGGLSSLFGGGYSAPDVPQTTPAPDAAEKEPVAKAIRDEEKRRLRARQPMSGTLLSSPLGQTQKRGGNMGLLGRTE